MKPITLRVNYDSGSKKFEVDRSSLKEKEGLHTYQWIVTKPDRSKSILSGITDNPYQRIPAYIRQFNQPRPKSELARLVANLNNKTVVRICKADPEKSAKAVEEALIASVKKSENLNKTAGGNGGGSWSQFKGKKPTVTDFQPATPEKYYPFKKKATHIAPETSPTIRNTRSAVYKVKNKETGESYIGMSTNVMKRIRTHASKASHAADTALTQAMKKNPKGWVFGVLPNTTLLSPLSLREAEKRAIEEKNPELNANQGGGGPAPMRRSPRLAKIKPQAPLGKPRQLAFD